MTHSALSSVLLVALFCAGPAEADVLDYVRPGGYAQYDLTRIESGPDSLSDSSQWRRIRFGLKGDLSAQLSYSVERDFADDRWKDVRLRLKSTTGVWTAGQFKQPFGLWNLDSDSRALLPESNATSLTAPDRRLGLMWQRLDTRHTLALSAFGKNTHSVGPDWGVAARATATRQTADGRWHLGLALGHEEGWDDLSFSLRPEVSSASGRFARTPSLAADTLNRWGIEAAWQMARWMVQGEWMGLDLDGAGAGDGESLQTGYMMANWTVFGPARVYKDGIFTAGAPNGGIGPLDLAVRFGSADLPAPVTGDIGQDTWTFGATLAIGKYSRVQSAYIVAEDDAGRDADIWQLRLQVQY
ncbi:MAG: porin [Xanthomonadaceae bacterium]|nr:porin [Xanthomonadaceae bacterium]